VVGDYGELPPGDLPSGSSVPVRLDLDYSLAMSLQQVPKDAPAYLLQARSWNKEQATALARALGITGDVVDQGGGSFRVTGGGDLYISGNLVQYIGGQNPATPSTGSLGSDDALVQAARAWLIRYNLVGSNPGSGTVVSRDDAARQALVRIKPAEPQSILSAIPSATVSLGPGGAVVEANVRWPGSLQRSNYGLRSAEDLWNDASQGRGYIEIPAESLPAGSGAVSGTVSVTAAGLAYPTAGNPEDQQYLVPLVVFSGHATISGASGQVPVRIYVPAVEAQAAPRG
jgi:hypothetical protein